MSGIDINITSNIKQVQREFKTLGKVGVKRAALRAINKTGTTVNKEAVKRVRIETGLPAKRVRTKLIIRKAGRGRLVWSLKGLRSTTNIIEWVTASKQVPGAFRKQKGVRSRAWKKSRIYPGTFIGKGRFSGKPLVFKRDSSKRSGVSSVHGPNIRSQFIKELKGLEFVARRRFGVVFEQEINFEMIRLLKRRRR